MTSLGWSEADIQRVTKVQQHWRRYVQRRKDCTVVRLYSFRGVRTVHNTKLQYIADPRIRDLVDSECEKEPLLYAGHVGVSADHGQHIYAWNPQIPANEPLETALQNLKNGMSYPGILSDDTRVFEQAALHHLRHGWNTRVSTVLIHVTEDQMADIQQTLNKLHDQTQHCYKYSFPKRTPVGASSCGFFEDDRTSNCATFARIFLGLETSDSRSGKMFSYASRAFAESAMLDIMEDSKR